MNEDKLTILNAFWRAGRRTFSPLTTEDLVRRSGMRFQGIVANMQQLRAEGLIAPGRDRVDRVMIYELTNAGKGIVIGGMIE